MCGYTKNDENKNSEQNLKQQQEITSLEEKATLQTNGNVEQTGAVLNAEKIMQVEEDNEAAWSTVSPGKSSHSPNESRKSLEYGAVSILSNSRFSVLQSEANDCDHEDKSEIEEEEKTQDLENVLRPAGKIQLEEAAEGSFSSAITNLIKTC